MTHSRPTRTLFEWCFHSVNVLWGANCFNTTTFLLNRWVGLFKVVYPRLYGMTWRHFTVSMNRISCEIHVGRQRSYRCSYKMILRRKHAVHQSMTPYQTERYSRPRHLAAHSPSTLNLKIEKCHCQIARFTGGPCISPLIVMFLCSWLFYIYIYIYIYIYTLQFVLLT